MTAFVEGALRPRRGPGRRRPFPHLPGRGASAERARTRLWVWPALAAAGALVGATLLGEARPESGSTLARWAWPGGRDAAGAMLQVIAGSVMTVTSLTFSLVIVTYQLASQQFSPRLLRELARDPVTKSVLAVLVGTFVFAVSTLRTLGDDDALPSLALLAAFGLAVVSVGALLGFLTHVARFVRVDSLMLSAHASAVRVIDDFYPPYGATEPPEPDEGARPPATVATITATSSGFVRRVALDALLDLAADHDAVVRLDVRPGDHVVRGVPIARAWGRGGRDVDGTTVADAVRDAVEIGYERTFEQDASLGFRQLTDIAVKALSPGINDPITAVHAIGHEADLLVRLTGRRLGPGFHADRDGVRRVVVPDRDLRYYLDLTCGQPRRYGGGEPTLLVALLSALRDVATSARDDEQREEIARQAALVVGEAPDTFQEEDAAAVHDGARRVQLALAGDLDGAYGDRSGETRSI